MLINGAAFEPHNFNPRNFNSCNFTSYFGKNNQAQSAFQVSKIEVQPDSFELSSNSAVAGNNRQDNIALKIGSKISAFFEQIKTAIKPDEPEISATVITYQPEIYDDIDLKTDVIKALDEKGKLVHLVAKLGLDEVYDYVTGVDHDKMALRYSSFLGKEQFDNLTHFYCLYTTAYNLIELTQGDADDSRKVIDKIKYLKRCANLSEAN